MRVIFLDIDGVLNSEEHARKMEAQHVQLGHTDASCGCFELFKHVDCEAIGRLNRLVAVTFAKIVVSSTWRKKFSVTELQALLGGYGLVGEIIDVTPDGHKTPELRETIGDARIFRGHEIDFWLQQHPDVESFVILDDDSDMVMHGNRLVQTDCYEGLLDEHVELAIRVMAWDGAPPSPLDDDPLTPPMITSTRSNASEDARRDFDGFVVDEELLRLRRALRDGHWRIAAELSANIDEHLSRGGSLPVAWLGPDCMQAPEDLEWRHCGTMDAAAKMTAQAREAVTAGYVAVDPAPIPPPGSSWGHDCHEKGCVEKLVLARSKPVQPSHEDDYQQLCPALTEAAVFLGWRLHGGVWWCPTHVIAKRLACARCLLPCPACACMGGPRGEAVDGMIIDVTEPTS